MVTHMSSLFGHPDPSRGFPARQRIAVGAEACDSAGVPLSPEAQARKPMRTVLTTTRLQLRAFRHDDAADLHVLLSDPRTNTIGSGPFTLLSQTDQWIRNRVTVQEEHGLCWYALRRRDTGELVGNCGMLRGRSSYAEPEIGYMIGVAHQGQGLASEAARAVLAECRACGITRVRATIRPHNTASRHIAARLGMTIDRIVRDERGDLLFHVVDFRDGIG